MPNEEKSRLEILLDNLAQDDSINEVLKNRILIISVLEILNNSSWKSREDLIIESIEENIKICKEKGYG